MVEENAPIFKVMIHKFDIPIPKKIAFQKFVRTTDPGSVDALTKATAARDDMIAHLAKQEPTQGLITAIENYIPHLFGLLVSVDGQPHIRLNDPLSFSWCSAVTNKRAYFTDYTFRYETVMTLMAYGFTFSNRAYSINNGMTDKTWDEESKQAAHFLRLAAGVFDYVNSVELPRWVNLPADRPLECVAAVSAALSLSCLAAAEELAVKKAVLKKTSMQTTSKLSADVWRKYEAAVQQMSLIPGDLKKILNPQWKAFLTACCSLQQANTLKYAGAAACDAKKIGLAISYLNVACKQLKDVVAPYPGSTLGPWKPQIDEQKGDIEHYQRLYVKENEMIAFEKVVDEALLEIPETRALMTAQAYTPPYPAFTQIK